MMPKDKDLQYYYSTVFKKEQQSALFCWENILNDQAQVLALRFSILIAEKGFFTWWVISALTGSILDPCYRNVLYFKTHVVLFTARVMLKWKHVMLEENKSHVSISKTHSGFTGLERIFILLGRTSLCFSLLPFKWQRQSTLIQHHFDFPTQTHKTISNFAFSTSCIQIFIIAIQFFLFFSLSFCELCRVNHDWSCNTFLHVFNL